MVNEAKQKSYKISPVYMYGHQVPRNHQQAVELDLANGNTKWQDSEKLEHGDQLWEYNTFDDRGHKSKATLPGPGYKKITLHFVYAVKHDMADTRVASLREATSLTHHSKVYTLA